MKVSIQIVTVALAASAAAHPQNGKKGPPSSTTSGSATSSTAAPSKGSMSNLPFMPTWFFRDSSQNKCISAYNACLIAKSSDQSPCASDYTSCIKTAASSGAPSGAPSSGPPTSTKPPPSATGSMTASRTTGRPQLPTSLRQWWGQEQGRRRCRYEHYTCIRDKSSDKADCDDKRASCFASAKTVTATTGPTSIPTRSATTTGTGSTATTSSTNVADAGVAPTGTGAPLNADDPSFDDDDSDDST
ncbi:hypothetical protein FVEN_g2938 [Fusarium venenatum]|uniref:Extracellular membrane protein CFEM domain-containing protein n=1 Tax=Fusarium venenatum TaxID=56646 RepID=A0A2L2SW32_9HYPO|nr:uncharacterized protein FVRRES_06318 [Fusarium venenatum]KAG8359521.1 hypothetical protein FVEN_g2938 [Fusarium venenatum]KAH6993327.1 hypothetical protein EDB82DRAFT_536320 [Fusarium venenatum]CEI61882.1 unnamed protein product [Fusarium venenatum]